MTHQEALDQIELLTKQLDAGVDTKKWLVSRSQSQEALIAKLDKRMEHLEEALERIARWSEAYPLQVFPEPDAAYYAKAAEVLRANGMTLDRLSAAAMRHVILQVGKIAKDALGE